MMVGRVTVNAKGQITLPAAVRRRAGIRPGDRVEVWERPDGTVVVVRQTTSGQYRSG